MTRTVIGNLPPATQTDDRPASEAVVDAVAAAEGVSALELHPPLATVIDPDALDALVDSLPAPATGRSGGVRFDYRGYAVTVTADGTVTATADPDR